MKNAKEFVRQAQRIGYIYSAGRLHSNGAILTVF